MTNVSRGTATKETSFVCEKHGDIGRQVLTVGVFDINRNFKQKTFCGVCHFEMLAANCCEAQEQENVLILKK